MKYFNIVDILSGFMFHRICVNQIKYPQMEALKNTYYVASVDSLKFYTLKIPSAVFILKVSLIVTF